MIKWLWSIIVGCSHTYEPYGNTISVWQLGESKERSDIPRFYEQSHRCSKCGNIKIFKV